MNKRGELNAGEFILLAIAVIVGAILLQASAQNIGEVTNTVSIANYTFTAAAEGESVYITDYRAVSGESVVNATGTAVPAANYTVTNNAVDPTTGGLSVQITTGTVNEYANDTWNLTATAQPTTYSDDSGGRAMATLIIIVMALALLVVVMVYALKGYK